jgi:hypothetical protein
MKTAKMIGLTWLLTSMAVGTAGCSDDGDGGGNGTTGGSGGTGATGGSGGTVTGGSGGTVTGGSGGTVTGGTGGTGGDNVGGEAGAAGAGTDCAAATAALITDFASAGQVGTPYTGADTGLTAPTAVTTTGAMVIAVNTGTPTTQYPYAFVGLGFDACVDASAYTGVTFNVSGTLNSECGIQFSTVDKAHNTPADGGTCTDAGGCYASAKVFTLPATATDVTVLFADQTGGGPPSTPVDPAEILAVQWQFNPVGNVPGPAVGCTGTVTIDNVRFTP